MKKVTMKTNTWSNGKKYIKGKEYEVEDNIAELWTKNKLVGAIKTSSPLSAAAVRG